MAYDRQKANADLIEQTRLRREGMPAQTMSHLDAMMDPTCPIVSEANDNKSSRMTLGQLHRAAVRNVPANHPKEAAWFRWWLLRGGF